MIWQDMYYGGGNNEVTPSIRTKEGVTAEGLQVNYGQLRLNLQLYER